MWLLLWIQLSVDVTRKPRLAGASDHVHVGTNRCYVGKHLPAPSPRQTMAVDRIAHGRRDSKPVRRNLLRDQISYRTSQSSGSLHQNPRPQDAAWVTWFWFDPRRRGS